MHRWDRITSGRAVAHECDLRSESQPARRAHARGRPTARLPRLRPTLESAERVASGLRRAVRLAARRRAGLPGPRGGVLRSRPRERRAVRRIRARYPARPGPGRPAPLDLRERRLPAARRSEAVGRHDAQERAGRSVVGRRQGHHRARSRRRAPRRRATRTALPRIRRLRRLAARLLRDRGGRRHEPDRCIRGVPRDALRDLHRAGARRLRQPGGRRR